jgi:hypothetical protein
MTVYRSGNITGSPFLLSSYDVNLPIIGMVPVTAVAVSTSNSPSSTDAEDPDFPIENLLNQSMHLRWASNDTPADIFLDVTGFTDDVNYVAFANHNFGGFTITIYGYTTNSPSDQREIFEATFINDNSPLLMEFPEGSYAQIRVKLSGSGVRTCAVMHTGLLLRMNRGVKVDADHAPVFQATKTDMLSGLSESGNFLGRLVRNQVAETKYEFTQIDNDFFGEGSDIPLFAFTKFYAPNYPFFIAWAPNDYPWDLGFVWTLADIMPLQNPVTRRWSMTLQVRGITGNQ